MVIPFTHKILKVDILVYKALKSIITTSKYTFQKIDDNFIQNSYFPISYYVFGKIFQMKFIYYECMQV